MKNSGKPETQDRSRSISEFIIEFLCLRDPAAGGGVLEHLPVAVRMAQRGDGLAADVGTDANGVAFLVVDEIDLRQAHQQGLPSRNANFARMLLPMSCSGGMP